MHLIKLIKFIVFIGYAVDISFGTPTHSAPSDSTSTQEPNTIYSSFDEYTSALNKTYNAKYLEDRRRKAFEENLNQIIKHNEDYKNGKFSFKLRTNSLADLSNSAYLKTFVRLTVNQSDTVNDEDKERVQAFNIMDNTLPAEIDWRQKGFITPPVNQKSCGSCYAFSIAHSITAQVMIRVQKVVSLSAQQIVDCSTVAGNHGCSGGSLRNTLRYLENSGGLMREKDYPYISAQGSCRFDPIYSVVNISSWSILPPKDEDVLGVALAQIGPLPVSINASPKTFQLYSEGIYDDHSCSSETVNHAMLLIGFTHDYWILKNWWGENWGEKGYMRIARGKNLCGLANYAAYAIV